ncbi:MAG: Xaa-Pro peptidase family protein [Candidatus Caldarchaeum sp.]
MLSSLDELMARQDVDAVVVYGESTASCPELAYLVRAPVARGGLYLKKRGEEPLLVVSNLDVESARTGQVSLVRTFDDYGLRLFVRRFGRGRGWAEFVSEVLRRERVGGWIVLAGRFEAGWAVFLAEVLRRRGFRVKATPGPSLLDICRRTKDSWEIERIREAGRKTVAVAQRVEKILEESRVAGDKVLYEKKPLTANILRQSIRQACAEQGLNLVEGFILAVGEESADPHYSGEKDTPIKPGEPVLLDIFPADKTGYRYDFTRTYCVGRAKPLLRKMFTDTVDAQNAALDMIRDNVVCEAPFIRVCRLFMARGWPTPLSKQPVERGFVHGLGHGLGLTIGEEPYLTRFSRDNLLTGDVVTVEPGLYDKSFGGVRVEDVVHVEGGGCVVLAEHRRELEL